MVLGIRSKSRKSVSVQVHFVIHVQEIKPWLPSKSLKSAQSVILQWENGDQNYGSFASSAENGKLEFNETLRFSAHLRKESSKRGRHRDGFHKKLLEFHLYDIQNGKSAKSQLLGSATINLADYGIIKETTAVSIPVNFKKSSKNSAQPFLNLSVQPFDIESSSSSPQSSLSKELSTDKEESESSPHSPNYENDEDLEIASFTDDESEDVSSTSSQTIQSASETTGDSTGISIGGTKGLNREFILPLETASTCSLVKAEAEPINQLNGIKSPMSSPVVPSDMGKNAVNDGLSVPKSHGKSVNNSYSNYKIPESIHQSSRKNITRDAEDKIISSTSYIPVDAPSNVEKSFQSEMIQEVSWRGPRFNKDALEKVSSSSKASILEGKEEKEQKEKGKEEKISMSNKLEEKVFLNLSEDDSIRKGRLKNVTVPLSRESHEQSTSVLNMDDKTEDRKSHKLPLDTAGSNKLFSRNQGMDLGEENSAQKDSHKGAVRRGQRFNKDGQEKVSSSSNAGILEGKEEKEQKEKVEEEKISMSNKLEEQVVLNLSEDGSIRKGKLKSVTVPLTRESHEQPTSILNMDDKTEDGKLHKLPLDTDRNNTLFSRNQVMDLGEENSALKDSHKGAVWRGHIFNKDGLEKVNSSSNTGILEGREEKEQKEKGEEKKISISNEPVGKVVFNLSEDDSIRKGKLKSVTVPVSRESHEQPTSILKMDDKREDGKSHKLPLDTAGNNRPFSRNQVMDLGEENNALKDSHKGVVPRGQRFDKDGLEKVSSSSNAGILEAKEEKEQKEKGEEKKISISNKPVGNVLLNLSEDDSIRKGKLKSVTVPLSEESHEQPTSILNMDDKTEDGKSHKLPLDTAGNNRLFSRNQGMDLGEENRALKDSHKGAVWRGQRFDKDGLEKVSSSSNVGILEGKEEKEQKEKGEKKKISMSNKPVGNVVLNLSEDNSINLKSVTVPLSRESHEQPTSILNMDDKIEDGKSHNLPLDTAGNNRLFSRNQVMDLGEENSALKDSHKGIVWRGQRFNRGGVEKVSSSSNASILWGKEEKEQKEKGEEEKISTSNNLVEKVVHNLSEDDSISKGNLKSVTVPLSRESHEQPTSILNMDDKTEDGNSHKLSLDTAVNNRLFSRNQAMDLGKENSALKDSHKGAVCHAGPDINDSRNQAMDLGEENSALKDSHNGAVSHAGPGINNSFLNSTAEIKSEVEMLQEELREAAALEVSLYSVVADHGSSANKVHTPARRLSRFYFHAYKVGSPATRASAAQSAVSGFVLVSKACGNDVPRLTFWLSNLIALRAILSNGVEKLQPAEVPYISSECDGSDSIEGSSLKRSWPHNTEEKVNPVNYSSDWEDPNFFLIALEKVEAWIFSRIVESVWWQTLTPHMQSAAAKSSGSKKIYGRKISLGDQEQGNFSIDLWKRAFKDACERLCPLRGVGHECGCLPVIARLVMEQLINRLDVAMFNAILRESDDEMPTDPISDPISDSKVLPIPAGKSGFGAGVQLKNVIGNWSRWLSDLFLIDDSESAEDKNDNCKNKSSQFHASFKPFHLLNALSDLMMLPFDMLTDGSTRNEVCPRFSVALIKRVLYNFVPDEFCPGPIPDAVLEALDAEDLEDNEGSITSFPCMAASTLYSPPPAASVMSILQEVGGHLLLRSGSSVLKKACTSDDELDELDSPFSAAAIDDLSVVSTAKKGRDVVRYKLLRQVWKTSE